MHTESSLKHKLKSSFLCFSAAHHSQSLHDHDGDLCPNNLHPNKSPRTPRSPTSSCSWRKKSPTADYPEPHRGRSRCLLSRIGWNNHHRSTQSGEFSYDPSSYALNFEDDSRVEDEDVPFRGFVSRLKPTPPPSAKFSEELLVVMPRQIVGFS